jgi:RimJ/RimL family protein N-acetyltransferase
VNAEPVTLEGETIRLVRMSMEHLPQLTEAGAFAELWKWTSTRADSPGEMEEYVTSALRDREAGVARPFVTVARESGEIIGSTRFGNIDRPNRKVEIGWTWITPAFQRTRVNTEAKYLMLRHAFETWNCVRVELKTDALNEKSRNAMLRIGAKFEGILRQHMVTSTGRLRDSAYYSIVDSEWPDVRERLLNFLSPR